MSRTYLKRINVNEDMNEKIKSFAKSKHLTQEEIVNEALDQYFNNVDNNHELKSEDIYTERINQLTEAIKELNHGVGNMNENLTNRLDVLVAYNESPTYLKDEN